MLYQLSYFRIQLPFYRLSGCKDTALLLSCQTFSLFFSKYSPFCLPRPLFVCLARTRAYLLKRLLRLLRSSRPPFSPPTPPLGSHAPAVRRLAATTRRFGFPKPPTGFPKPPTEKPRPGFVAGRGGPAPRTPAALPSVCLVNPAPRTLPFAAPCLCFRKPGTETCLYFRKKLAQTCLCFRKNLGESCLCFRKWTYIRSV